MRNGARFHGHLDRTSYDVFNPWCGSPRTHSSRVSALSYPESSARCEWLNIQVIMTFMHTNYSPCIINHSILTLTNFTLGRIVYEMV